MNARKAALPLLFAAGALLSAGCNPPKYVNYVSIHRDFRGAVPWGWNVMTDDEGAHYASTTFIGPFDPDFYLGAPSLSVRWYRYSEGHRLPDALVETYKDADDYINQTLRDVYGPQYELRPKVHEIKVAGRLAKHFVVLSATVAPPGARWGTAVDVKTRAAIVPREHAYVILPLSTGFYVLIYPATVSGFEIYSHQFNELVNTFTPLQEGPGGAKLGIAGAAPAPAPVKSRR